jgi:hypothetical protein
MQLARRIVAADPRMFGRGPLKSVDSAPVVSGLGDDLRLFATTFLAGFIFVSVLIG